MLMVDETGELDEVLDVQMVRIDEPVYDIDVDRTHNFVANGIVTHNSIYKFRGADFRNLLKFEDAFPEATTVVLDQNYRSTQRILDAANAVIENNATHRPKHLWTDRAKASRSSGSKATTSTTKPRSWCARSIGSSTASDHRYGDIAVFYRTNVQSRVLEEALVAVGHSVPRVRRREVLRPARDQGRARVPARARESRRRSVVEAHRQHAAARRRRHVGRQDRRLRGAARA